MLKTAKCVYVLLRVHETSDGSSQSNSSIGIIHRFLNTVDHSLHWS